MQEILETIGMVQSDHLDIRTVTLGISLRDCAGNDAGEVAERVYSKLTRTAARLADVTAEVEAKIGIPIVNRRISVTPVALLLDGLKREDPLPVIQAMDKAAVDLGVDFIGGYSALVEKGMSRGDRILIDSLPEALASTQRVCGSVNLATSKAGINMDAVYLLAKVIRKAAWLTRDQDSIACAKLVVFANAPTDNPFMAGAFHGVSEGEATINVGVSGPGAVLHGVRDMGNIDFSELTDRIKRLAFKITRLGEMVGREVAAKMGIPFGIVDVSLAPTPAEGDSVADIIEAMGIETCGGYGTVAALAMLNDAVKKGGLMATSHVGGLSGAFIPVSEDQGMIRAAQRGILDLPMLLAMTSVCSVGLDMVAIPGDTEETTLAALIADEMAIGVINHKTTACRLIPAWGKQEGDTVEYGGLLGAAPIMAIKRVNADRFIHRGGRIPAPLTSAKN